MASHLFLWFHIPCYFRFRLSVSQVDLVFHGKPVAVTRLTQAASINVLPSGWSCPVSHNPSREESYPSREESKQLFALALSYGMY